MSAPGQAHFAVPGTPPCGQCRHFPAQKGEPMKKGVCDLAFRLFREGNPKVKSIPSISQGATGCKYHERREVRHA